MNSDIPKPAIIINYVKPDNLDPILEISKKDVANDDYGANGQQKSEAPDLGGFPVTTSGGTAGTASGVSTSTVGPNLSWGEPVYIIPRYGPILEVEVDRQIEAKKLSEAAELGTK